MDRIVRAKKNLKGSGHALFGDTTRLNRELCKTLNARPEVESAWFSGPSVWCKLVNGGKKMKIGINDNLNQKLSLSVSPPNTFMYNSTATGTNTRPKAPLVRLHQSPITPRRTNLNNSTESRMMTPLMLPNTSGPATGQPGLSNFNNSTEARIMTPLMLPNTFSLSTSQFVPNNTDPIQPMSILSPTGVNMGSIPIQTSTPAHKPTISI